MERKKPVIRKAEREDSALIFEFIKGIAKYEKMENEIEATVELLEEQLFDKGRAEVIFAMEDGKEVGFALFFHNFSTFVGRSGLYLEDLYVYPEYRGKGYGKALFMELVRIANKRKCGRMEWVCLNWNTPSIEFYRSMGAVALDEWTTYRLTEGTIERLTNNG
ncbi:MAG: GNAT family N-acetyltransferase [Bacteroidaceae bacterium]|nr:GNAT family N-acetyltransferase [Bacteroidaceae bacterium]